MADDPLTTVTYVVRVPFTVKVGECHRSWHASTKPGARVGLWGWSIHWPSSFTVSDVAAEHACGVASEEAAWTAAAEVVAAYEARCAPAADYRIRPAGDREVSDG